MRREKRGERDKEGESDEEEGEEIGMRRERKGERDEEGKERAFLIRICSLTTKDRHLTCIVEPHQTCLPPVCPLLEMNWLQCFRTNLYLPQVPLTTSPLTLL